MINWSWKRVWQKISWAESQKHILRSLSLSCQKKAWLASAQLRDGMQSFGEIIPKEGFARLVQDKPSFGMTMTTILRPVFAWHPSHSKTVCFSKLLMHHIINLDKEHPLVKKWISRRNAGLFSHVTTLFSKRIYATFRSCLSFGEECMSVNLGLYIISSRPYVRVSDPGAPEKMERLKLRFFWKRVYLRDWIQSSMSEKSNPLWGK